jgi:hypothetical protein
MVTATGDPVGQPSSTTESLAGWAAPYVTGMLGKGEALANQPYQAYGGPLTAGQSGLQTQAFQGLAGLTVPTAQMGGFTPTSFTSGTTAPTAQQNGIGSLGPQQGQMPNQMPTMIDTMSHLNDYFEEGGNPYKALLEGRATPDQVEQAFVDAQSKFDAANPTYQYAEGTDRYGARFARKAAEQAEQERMQAIFPPLEIDPTTMRPLATSRAADRGTTSNPAAGSVAQQYMSPFMNAALEPQMAEAQRQAEIQRVQNAGRLGRAGAYGGGRQAIMESEGQRNLLRNLADIYGTGMQTAYTQGMGQFNTEQDRARQAQEYTNKYGLESLKAMQDAGAIQRDIEQQGIAADYAQFKEERDFPYKQVQYQQSLLQDLPISATEREYIEPSEFAKIMGYIGTATEAADAIYGGTCPPGQSKNVFGICTGSTCPKGQSKNIFGFCS